MNSPVYVSLSDSYKKKIGSNYLVRDVNYLSRFKAPEIGTNTDFIFLDQENVIAYFSPADSSVICEIYSFDYTVYPPAIKAQKSITVIQASGLSLNGFKDVSLQYAELADITGGNTANSISAGKNKFSMQSAGTFTAADATAGTITGYKDLHLTDTDFYDISGGNETATNTESAGRKYTFSRTAQSAAGSAVIVGDTFSVSGGDIFGYKDVMVRYADLQGIEAGTSAKYDCTDIAFVPAEFYDQVAGFIGTDYLDAYLVGDNGFLYSASIEYFRTGTTDKKQTTKAILKSSETINAAGSVTIQDSAIENDVEAYKNVTIYGTVNKTVIDDIDGGNAVKNTTYEKTEVIKPVAGTSLHTMETTTKDITTTTTTSTGKFFATGKICVDNIDRFEELVLMNIEDLPDDTAEPELPGYEAGSIEGGRETYKYSETVTTIVQKDLNDPDAAEIPVSSTENYSEQETETATGQLTVTGKNDTLADVDDIFGYKTVYLDKVDVSYVDGGNYSYSSTATYMYGPDSTSALNAKNTETYKYTSTGTLTMQNSTVYGIYNYLNLNLHNTTVSGGIDNDNNLYTDYYQKTTSVTEKDGVETKKIKYTEKSSCTASVVGKAQISYSNIDDIDAGYKDMEISDSVIGGDISLYYEATSSSSTEVRETVMVDGLTVSETTTSNVSITGISAGNLKLSFCTFTDNTDIAAYANVTMQGVNLDMGAQVTVQGGTVTLAGKSTETELTDRLISTIKSTVTATGKGTGKITVDCSLLDEVSFYRDVTVKNASYINEINSGYNIRITGNQDSITEDNGGYEAISGSRDSRYMITLAGKVNAADSRIGSIAGYKDVTLKNTEAAEIRLYEIARVYISAAGINSDLLTEKYLGTDISIKDENIATDAATGEVSLTRTYTVKKQSDGKVTMTGGKLIYGIYDYKTVSLTDTVLSASSGEIVFSNCGSGKLTEVHKLTYATADDFSSGDLPVTDNVSRTLTMTTNGKLTMTDVDGALANGNIVIQDYAEVSIVNSGKNSIYLASVTNRGIYTETEVTSSSKAGGKLNLSGYVYAENVRGYQNVTVSGSAEVSLLDITWADASETHTNVFVKGTLNLDTGKIGKAVGYQVVNISGKSSLSLFEGTEKADTVTVKKDAMASLGSLSTGVGNDTVKIDGFIMNMMLEAGDGNDTMTLGANGYLGGVLNFGTGNDTLNISGVTDLYQLDMGSGDDKVNINKGGVLRYHMDNTASAIPSPFGGGTDTLVLNGDLVLLKDGWSDTGFTEAEMLNGLTGELEKAAGKGVIAAETDLFNALESEGYTAVFKQYKFYNIGDHDTASAFQSTKTEAADDTKKGAADLTGLVDLSTYSDVHDGWLCGLKQTDRFTDKTDWIKFTLEDTGNAVMLLDDNGFHATNLAITGLTESEVTLYDKAGNAISDDTILTWNSEFARLDIAFDKMAAGNYTLKLESADDSDAKSYRMTLTSSL